MGDHLWYKADGKLFKYRSGNRTLFKNIKVICDKVYPIKLKRGDPVYYKSGKELLPRYIHSVEEYFVTLYMYGRDEFTWSGKTADLIVVARGEIQPVAGHTYSN